MPSEVRASHRSWSLPGEARASHRSWSLPGEARASHRSWSLPGEARASHRGWSLPGEARAASALSEQLPLPALAAGVGATVGARALFTLVYSQMRAIAAAARSRDLDDLVQVALERVLRGLPAFQGRSELSTWTYRICYLTLIDHERGAARWLRRFVTGRDLPERAHPDPDPAQSLEVGERIQRLRAALRRVSPKQRAVVVLHDLEELGFDEISEIVGAKRNTVKSRLRAGHRQLAQLLRNDPYFGDEVCAKGGDL